MEPYRFKSSKYQTLNIHADLPFKISKKLDRIRSNQDFMEKAYMLGK